jgi:hypothetical protein
MSEKEQKFLDEDDVIAAIEAEEANKPSDSEDVDSPMTDDDKVMTDDDNRGQPVTEDNWMEQAKAEGWVPDHVRAKHANKAKVLEDKVANLERTVSSYQRQDDPDYDPNMPVTTEELEAAVKNIQVDQNDPALLSEQLMRFNTPDYDDVITEYVEPLAGTQPWLAGYLRNQVNPAKSAYDIGIALRDGKDVNMKLGLEGMEVVLEEDQSVTPPVRHDKNNPPLEAVERASKQPTTLDEVPAATADEATAMNVEDFFSQSVERLMEIRASNPEMYRSMQEKFHGKYT